MHSGNTSTEKNVITNDLDNDNLDNDLDIIPKVNPPKKGFLNSLKDNPVFAGGAGVAMLAVGLSILRGAVLQGIIVAQKHLTVSLEVPSKDHSYQWVLQWLTAHGNKRHLGVETTFKQQENGRVSTNFAFVPGPGTHWIGYKRTLIQVVRERENSVVDLQTGTPWETVTLTAVGRNREIFADLLNDAKKYALSKEEGKTIIYTSFGTEWRPFGRPRPRRPLQSVILANNLSEKIANDVLEFNQSSKWYMDRGIPYRRGYLLHGPPGCGKSSFITALAGSLEYNICLLNLNDRGLTDDRLNHLMALTPPRSFVLLEDIDAAFVERTAQEQSYSLTFSGLLNCLDGVGSTEERIVFMTTNFPEKLDRALIRPGRVDFRAEISLAVKEQVQKLFEGFYPTANPSLAIEFVKRYNFPLSMAHLQGYLMLYKEKPEEAIKYFQEFQEVQKQLQ